MPLLLKGRELSKMGSRLRPEFGCVVKFKTLFYPDLYLNLGPVFKKLPVRSMKGKTN
jgi:hypothetical protein